MTTVGLIALALLVGYTVGLLVEDRYPNAQAKEWPCYLIVWPWLVVYVWPWRIAKRIAARRHGQLINYPPQCVICRRRGVRALLTGTCGEPERTATPQDRQSG